MLAALFIQGGISALRAPSAHAARAKPVLDAVEPAVDKVVEVAPIEHRPDNELLIKVDAGVKIGAGTLLAMGKFPRVAATALAASLIPTTLAGHRFWEETDAQRKQEQQIHFLKNVGLLGGLMIAAADTEGRPSLAWRGRRAARLAASQTAAVSGAVANVGGRVSGAAHDVTGRVTGTAHDVTGRLSGGTRRSTGTAAGIAAGLAGLVPGAVSSRPRIAATVAETAEDWSKSAAKAAKRARKRGAALQKRAAKRSAALQKRAAKRGLALQKAAEKKRAARARKARLDQATKLGHDVAERAATIGHEIAEHAQGAAKDARKRVTAMSR
jgi:uncharacterized membrane protein YphA (DoxX/SURF4 family)